MKSLIWAILFYLLLTPVASMGKNRGSSVEELYSLSNMAYVDGRYEEAIRGYSKMIKKGMVNPDVYFNLANSYAKAGKSGYAILYFEKSLKLLPGEEDVANNLALMYESLEISTSDLDARSPLDRILGLTTFKGSADFTLFVYVISFCLLVVILLNKNEKIKSKMRVAAISSSLIIIISLIITISNLYHQENAGFAIVLEKGVPLFEAPLEQASSSEILNEGSKIKVIDDSKSWFKVSASNGAVGWVQKKGVEVI